MPPNVRSAIIDSTIEANPQVRAFWRRTMSPDERPLDADEAPGDFLHDLQAGRLDDELGGDLSG